MSSTVLLVDFGASRIKVAAWSFVQEKIIASKDYPAPSPKFGIDGSVEIDPQEYWIILEASVGEILQQHPDIDSLWLCTEMHGFLLTSADGSEILTPYISWRDERASRKNSSGLSTLNSLTDIADKFFSETKMELRSGLPFVTLSHLKKNITLPESFRIFTLADWLLWCGGEKDPKIHSSLAAGTGFFSVENKTWSPDLISLLGCDFKKIIFPKIATAGEIIGRITIAGHKIKVFGGIGDLQAAAHGTGFPSRAKLLINLGTGSQALGDIPNPSSNLQIRIGVGNENFSAITHIPSGRALNVFAKFFDDCAKLSGGKDFFWKIFSSLTAAEVLDSKLEVDLKLFEASWCYKNGGAIMGIKEENFSARELIAAIANSWLKQYLEAILEIDPKQISKTFLLAGGLSRRGEFILPTLEEFTKRKGLLASTLTNEETLDGLLTLSKLYS